MSTESTIKIEDLTAKPLPIFRHSAQAFHQLQPLPEVDFNAYGEIIRKDPGLTLHMLQELQPKNGKTSRTEIANVAQATMLLGTDRVQQLTRGRPQLEGSLSGIAQAGYARAACRAFHAAFQAWDWAHIKNDLHPEDVFLAALLHDVAEMALWVAAPERIHHLRKLIFKDRLHTDEAQYLALGESLEHFSRQIAFRWHLPPLVHEALRPENAVNSRVHGIMLAVQLGRAAERGWYSPKMASTLEQIAEYLGTSLEETTAHIHYNAARAAHQADFYGARPAAALLPLLPGDEHIMINDEFPEPEKTRPQVPVDAVPQAEDGQHATDKIMDNRPHNALQDEALQANDPSVPTAICLTPQPAIFAETVKQLQAGHGKMDLNDIMRTTVHGLHDGVGLNRVVFTMLSPDRKKLISRFIIGADNDPSFSRFNIGLDIPNLFSRLLDKPVSLWVNNENRDKFWKLIPGDFKTLIKTNTFYTMSIHIDNKPIGLFYADRRGPECQLDENSYKQFRQLCQLASKSLASISKPVK